MFALMDSFEELIVFVDFVLFLIALSGSLVSQRVALDIHVDGLVPGDVPFRHTFVIPFIWSESLAS